MKKRTIIILLAVLVLMLATAALVYFKSQSGYPTQAADGAPWDESWLMMGSVLGLEEPGNGFVMEDSSAFRRTDELSFASWTAGESLPYTDADGNELQVYEAQLYVLAVERADPADAAGAIDQWIGQGTDTYSVRETGTETYNGQEYDLIYYDCAPGAGPYARGVTAFTAYGNYAISAELSCRDSFAGDEAAILADVLSRFHYSADIHS